VDQIFCDNCDEEISKVFEDKGQTIPQGVGMLSITLASGYGRYFDGCGEAQFCRRCADDLAAAFPSLKKVMDER
jgi:hypothetical protein